MLATLKTITLPQALVVAAMLAFSFAAHKYLGQDAGMAMGGATTLVALLLGRGPAPDGGAQ